MHDNTITVDKVSVSDKLPAQYIVICQSIVGSPSTGYSTQYDWDGWVYGTRKDAIRHGFKIRDSDDFNIGVLQDGKLIQFCWMDEVLEYDLDEVVKML